MRLITTGCESGSLSELKEKRMEKLYSRKGNYFVSMDASEGRKTVEIEVADGVQEKMEADTTSDTKRIKCSIEKWEFIAALAAFGIGIWSDGGRFTCALCMKYNNLTSDCDGCPIQEATSRSSCEDTPYEEFHQTSAVDTVSQHVRASEEIEFLRNILAHEDDAPF